MKKNRLLKLFLRLVISLGFLSAVADRFGYYWDYHLVWGNWQAFVDYTNTLTPWLPDSWGLSLAVASTAAEIIFALALLIGFKTEIFAKLSGLLLLVFALSMTFSTGLKTAFDASVYTASGGAFALATLRDKFLELDVLLTKLKWKKRNYRMKRW